MGVPHFMNWLVTRYPLIARRMDWASRPRFDCFFIDFNCIIHTAYRSNKTIDDDGEEEIITEVLRFLDVLVQVIRPTSLIFVSVDGPAPFAKCVQQRSRRFIREKKTDVNDSSNDTFSTNAISVGTFFMEKLHQKLSDFLKERVSNDPTWNTPKVVYSSYRTPGEGEHKFFDFIRKQRHSNLWNENASCCVYSPDADLAFVCLLSRIKNFCILRESEPIFQEIRMKRTINDSGIKHCANDFVLISLNLMREYLMLDFETKDNRLFDDFAALSFLIGNDFIPHFPDMKIDKGEFSFIVSLYKNHFLSKKKFLVEGTSFNLPNLSEFLKLAATKLGLLKKKAPNYEGLYQNAEIRLRSKMPEEFEKNPEELKRKMSLAIIESFSWVLKYYKEGVPSWSWYYPYHYAPPIIIVADYVKEHIEDFQVDSPPLPYIQLLSILPPQSKNLLPNALQPLMEEGSPIEYLFPSEFHISREKKEGTAIIPFVDVNLVKEAFKKVEGNLTNEEKDRNKKIPPYLITVDMKTKTGMMHHIDESTNFINFNHIFSNDSQLPCVPSLFLFDLKPNVVTRPKFNENNTLVLNFNVPTSPDHAQNLINKTILVGWPYLLPAIVKKVENFNNKSAQGRELLSNYQKIYGLDISNTEVIIRANVLQFTDNHENFLQWSRDEAIFPFQLTLPIAATNTMKRFVPPEFPKNMKDTFPKVGDLVVVGSGNIKRNGSLCRIQSIDNNMFTLSLIKPNTPDKIIDDIQYDDQNHWIPISRVAFNKSLPVEVIQALFTDMHTEKNKINISLCVIKEKKGIEGFVTSKNNNILVTQEIVDFLSSYFKFTDPLLLALQTISDDKTMTDVLDEYFDVKNDDEPVDFAEEIKKWVKDHSPAKKYPFRSLYQNFPTHKTLATMEECLKNHNIEPFEKKTFLEPFKEPFKNIIWKGKLLPNFPQNYDQKRVQPGMRAIVISPTGVIPFGTMGYIIGLSFNGQLAHLISVKELQYGNRMRGCLTTKRGFIMPVHDLYVIQY
ncbi:XRN 5'-3' exonuclease N-terminus family protein [Tritrichomonas foetus]|uniref:XRN 5'-3' exonuclease N-terminus family protein n=1 Tax=Tritrichomonas foetus TaxID=1144522 RepID=A0A1J4JV28_9EUKA|nr:XRN 5'-3' exonuclease N-terminus family protein [Tritrichomonas foetus]|eukprot:OHT03015.1 XRN 5'-3' exonuclease N-terminus family protein [Tritrichomonas foetus]